MELFYLTAKGLEYFAQTATGKTMNFTKGKFGNGTYTGTVTELTDLINPLGEMTISKKTSNDNSVTVTTQFSNRVNGVIIDPFYLKEIGLFAKMLNSDGTEDTSNPETLVAYASATGTGDRIPGVLTEFIINFPFTVSNTDNVTVTTGTLIYATKDELDSLSTGIGDLSTLVTDDKSSIVAAINEAASKGGGIPIVIASSTDGRTYTATLDGVDELTNGFSMIIIPNKVSASTTPTLNLNGLGAKSLKMSVGYQTSLTQNGAIASWLSVNKPIQVTYDGSYWKTELQLAHASSLYGTVPISKGGTGATTAAQALINLGAAPAYSYGTEDLTAGTSALADGKLHFVYE